MPPYVETTHEPLPSLELTDYSVELISNRGSEKARIMPINDASLLFSRLELEVAPPDLTELPPTVNLGVLFKNDSKTNEPTYDGISFNVKSPSGDSDVTLTFDNTNKCVYFKESPTGAHTEILENYSLNDLSFNGQILELHAHNNPAVIHIDTINGSLHFKAL